MEPARPGIGQSGDTGAGRDPPPAPGSRPAAAADWGPGPSWARRAAPGSWGLRPGRHQVTGNRNVGAVTGRPHKGTGNREQECRDEQCSSLHSKRYCTIGTGLSGRRLLMWTLSENLPGRLFHFDRFQSSDFRRTIPVCCNRCHFVNRLSASVVSRRRNCIYFFHPKEPVFFCDVVSRVVRIEEIAAFLTGNNMFLQLFCRYSFDSF